MSDTEREPLALRWWNTLQPRERIVAMSLIAGGAIAITNSTVWAIAVCYMNHDRVRNRATHARLPQPIVVAAPEARQIAGEKRSDAASDTGNKVPSSRQTRQSRPNNA